jgi:hypothetical protein
VSQDLPFRLETVTVWEHKSGRHVESYLVRNTADGVFCQTDQFWKARKIIDALNKLEEVSK